MLKKFDELTDEEKGKVQVMYSDLSNLKMYLYNFDKDGGYHGRQYTPPLTVRADSTEPSKPKTEPTKPARRRRKANK